jgi:hypothetical protein
MVNIQRESHIQNIHVHVHVVRVGLLSIADARTSVTDATNSNIDSNTRTTTTTTTMANMFGALNRFISRLDADPSAQKQRSSPDTYGFQVLRNTNPELPLEPWFDSIIGINGRTIVSA